MKFSHILFSCLIGIMASSCGNSQTPLKTTSPAPKKNIDITIASLSTPVDPVCGMTLKKDEVGDTTNYGGKLYGFCGTGCKNEFLKTPDQYLKPQ